MGKKLKDFVADKPEVQRPEPAQPGPLPTAAELRARVEAEMQERQRACLAEINQVLTKHNCFIGTMPVIEDGLVQAVWGVKARE